MHFSVRWVKLYLILFRHILTAAHCLEREKKAGEEQFVWDDITVVLGERRRNLPRTELSIPGEHNLADLSESVTFVSKAKVTERKKHPKFFIKQAEGFLKYDFAILELENPIDFRNYSHIR